MMLGEKNKRIKQKRQQNRKVLFKKKEIKNAILKPMSTLLKFLFVIIKYMNYN